MEIMSIDSGIMFFQAFHSFLNQFGRNWIIRLFSSALHKRRADEMIFKTNQFRIRYNVGIPSRNFHVIQIPKFDAKSGNWCFSNQEGNIVYYHSLAEYFGLYWEVISTGYINMIIDITENPTRTDLTIVDRNLIISESENIKWISLSYIALTFMISRLAPDTQH